MVVSRTVAVSVEGKKMPNARICILAARVSDIEHPVEPCPACVVEGESTEELPAELPVQILKTRFLLQKSP